MNDREMKMKYVIVMALSLLLGACGGSGSPIDPLPPGDPLVERNVALASDGATVSTNYDEGSAEYVIDGDTSQSLYWSGNITDDFLKIDFGSVVELLDLTIFTNDLTFSTFNPSKVIEISVDGNSWFTTGSLVGGDIPCLNSTTGQNRIFCEFDGVESARYLRVTITSEDSPGLIKIFEVQATGA